MACRVHFFARLGAYFSFPGYFLHERKARQREVFRHIPADRLLVETDVPDQLPPDALIRHSLSDPATSRALNHPANLAANVESFARYLGRPDGRQFLAPVRRRARGRCLTTDAGFRA